MGARGGGTSSNRSLGNGPAILHGAHRGTIIYLNDPSKLARFSLWNGTRAGPTAAVERAHSDRARSGSKGSARVSFHPFSVDSKLSCPVDVAHDLSGFAFSALLRRALEIVHSHLPQDRRSSGARRPTQQLVVGIAALAHGALPEAGVAGRDVQGPAAGGERRQAAAPRCRSARTPRRASRG